MPLRNTFNVLYRNQDQRCSVDAPVRQDLRVALNAVRLAELGLVNAVDLGELDVLLFELGRRLLVMGCERLAVSTPRQTYISYLTLSSTLRICLPRRKELDEHEVLRVYRRAEVGIGEGNDIASVGGDKAGE